MKILLTRSEGVSEQLLRAVHSELQSDGPLTFSVASDENLRLEDGHSPKVFFNALEKHRANISTPPEDYLCALTERANENNWFSEFDEAEANIFIHTEGWEFVMLDNCPAEIPIAYQVLANFLQREVYGSSHKWYEASHKESIGCINDLCGYKPDVSFKVRTADICKPCCQYFLKSKKITEPILEQILTLLDRLRKKALRSRSFNATSNEDLPSTVAYTKRRLFVQSEMKTRTECLINHFDSLLKTTLHMLGRILIPENFEGFLTHENLHEMPSLGRWEEGLLALSKVEFQVNPLDLGIKADVSKILKEAHKEGARGRITKTRNDLFGHGYVREEKAYESAYNQCYPHVSRIEKILSPLMTAITLCQMGKRSDKEGGMTCVEYLELQGDHPMLFKEKKDTIPTVKITKPLIEGRVYAQTPNGEFHDLHDSLVRQQCNKCQHVRLLISDGSYYFNNYEGLRFPKDSQAKQQSN